MQAQTTNTASDGSAPSTSNPSLEYSTDKCGAVLAAPVLFFAVVAFVVCRRPRVIFLRGAVYDGRTGQAFKDHCAVELIVSSADPSTPKRIGRGVRNFDRCLRRREAKFGLSWHLCQIYAESPHEKAPFEHWQKNSTLEPVWGIGLGADDPRSNDPRQWRWKLFLGEAPSAVREPFAKVRPGRHASPLLTESAFPPGILEFTRFRQLRSHAR